MARLHGETLSAPLAVRLRPPLRAALTELAEQEDRSLNWLVNRLLQEALAQRGHPAGQTEPKK